MPLWESLARYHAARAAFLREDWSDAADRLVPENPLMPRAELVAWHGLRAATLAAIGKQNDADRALRRLKDTASAVPPGFGAAAWQRYYSGRAAMARGDYARAAEEIAAALQNFPPGDAIAEIWYFLGSCQEKAALGIARDAFASGAEYPASFHFARLCKAALNAGDSIPFIRLTAP
jgi:tetratricopeptide (TPR) repeat protein